MYDTHAQWGRVPSACGAIQSFFEGMRNHTARRARPTNGVSYVRARARNARKKKTAHASKTSRGGKRANYLTPEEPSPPLGVSPPPALARLPPSRPAGLRPSPPPRAEAPEDPFPSGAVSASAQRALRAARVSCESALRPLAPGGRSYPPGVNSRAFGPHVSSAKPKTKWLVKKCLFPRAPCGAWKFARRR